jgi:hypothetical protein
MGLYACALWSRLGIDRLGQIAWTRLHVGKTLRWFLCPLTRHPVPSTHMSSYCDKVAATANTQHSVPLIRSQLEVPAGLGRKRRDVKRVLSRPPRAARAQFVRREQPLLLCRDSRKWVLFLEFGFSQQEPQRRDVRGCRAWWDVGPAARYPVQTSMAYGPHYRARGRGRGRRLRQE